MSYLDWNRIDDYGFVKLVGELFGRFGFVDIDYQGDGPDGGIDLFATELLPFTVQGRTPFRWAIQCKFSVKGKEASVNDAEVRDVEGILRSDRYQMQAPRGYMLVTNRKIVQNVIERLRGIDRRSQYRTARVDGSHLESMLAEHPELVERYFGERRSGPLGFRKPVVIVSPPSGDAHAFPPSILVALSAPTSTPTPATKVRAILDTGASTSIIPEQMAHALALQPIGYALVSTPAGQMEMPHYKVQIAIEQIGQFQVEMLGAELDTVIIGRDILRRFNTFIRADGGLDLYKP